MEVTLNNFSRKNYFVKTIKAPIHCNAFSVNWLMPQPAYSSYSYTVLFLVSRGKVKLSLLSLSVTNWPFVPVSDDRCWWWWWLWSSPWNWQGKPKYAEETCLRGTLSTTNPTWFDLDSNWGSRRLTGRAIARPLRLAGLEVLTTVTTRSTILWVVTQWKVRRSCGETHQLYFQRWRSK
jgi:hypothetical protein